MSEREPEAPPTSRATVIIPAHNEERGIARLLAALTGGDPRSGPQLEIIVVCNGCTDRTAGVARSFSPAVTVIEQSRASKHLAMRAGDSASTALHQIYVDADVEINRISVDRLVEALEEGPALAAGPARVIPRAGVSTFVRAYYDVWERLPQVRCGLFGRGVVAVSGAGRQRLRDLPPVLSDDLAMSEAFGPRERVLVDAATVTVHPPRTLGDLLRRRVRVVIGNVEADRQGLRSEGSATSVATLLDILRREPAMVFRLPVFLAVTVLARLGARRAVRTGDFTTWLRDESSRARS